MDWITNSRSQRSRSVRAVYMQAQVSGSAAQNAVAVQPMLIEGVGVRCRAVMCAA